MLHAGRRYSGFGTTYPVRTTFVVGEFYWRAAVGEEVKETDFVTPGTMLAREDSGAEQTWTALQLQDCGVAERAFGLPPRPATTPGVPAPHEPSPHRTTMRDAWMVAALALAACIVIAIGTAGSSRVLQRQLAVPPTGAMPPVVLGPIAIERPSERVRITAQAGGLSNEWLDLDYSLVDRATQRSYDASGTAEYYSGRDSDGSWSEGDTAPKTALASVPRGTYDLVVEAAAHQWADPSAPPPQPTPDPYEWYRNAGLPVPPPEPVAPVEPDPPLPVTITVERGGGFAGPFWLAAIAILAWPLIALSRHLGFEARRTASTTASSDDEDEDDA